MSISAPFIARPIAPSLLAVAVLLSSVLAYSYLPISSLPQVDFPVIQVTTQLPGANADTMARLITAPLERQLGQIPSLENMSSASSQGLSQITLQFARDRDINAAGQDVPVPDLVGQAVDATLARLGMSTPEDALAFFRRHAEGDFRSLHVAVRFPALPEYYSPHMDLLAEIDRGDVWYDFPFNDKGVRVGQGRDRFPSFTLFVKWRGEKVPLASWRTTIGGWRTEVAADGE